MKAVIPEQPRFIQRRFLRKSKKRFQVRMCSGTEVSGVVAGDVDAARSPSRVEGKWCFESCVGDALGVKRGCFDDCEVKLAVKRAGAKRGLLVVLAARRQVVRVQRRVAMVVMGCGGVRVV